MKVFWTPPAEADLNGVILYIAEDNVDAAFDAAEDIQGAPARLGDMPHMGRQGRAASARELVVPHTPYVVIYRIMEKQVEILRVMHGAQDWPPKET